MDDNRDISALQTPSRFGIRGYRSVQFGPGKIEAKKLKSVLMVASDTIEEFEGQFGREDTKHDEYFFRGCGCTVFSSVPETPIPFEAIQNK